MIRREPLKDPRHLVLKVSACDDATLARVAADLGVVRLGATPEIRSAVFHLNDGQDGQEVLAAARAHPDVQLAGLDGWRVHRQPKKSYFSTSDTGPLQSATTDTLAPMQWGLLRMSVYPAWKMLAREGIGRGSPEVTLASFDDFIEDGYADLPVRDIATRTVAITSEPFTIDGGGTATLKYPPDKHYALTVTVNGQPRTLTTGALAPGLFTADTRSLAATTAGITASEYTGTLRFDASSDAGLTGTASYYDRRATAAWDWLETKWNWAHALMEYDLGPNDYMHGAAVMGVLAANTNNGSGMAGGAPDCRFVYATTDAENSWQFSRSVVWLVQHGAKVISCSTFDHDIPASGSSTDARVQAQIDAAQYAWDNGALLFVAVANDSKYWDDTTVQRSPANLPHCIPVAASMENDLRWFNRSWDNVPDPTTGSNYGPKVLVVAPGNNILSTFIRYGSATYAWFGHTSAACPNAAFVAALLWSANPALTNQQAKDILLSTCDPCFSDTPASFTSNFPNAAGIPNAAKAVAKAFSTNPAKTGRVFLAPGFWRAPPYPDSPRLSQYIALQAGLIGDGPHSLTTIAGGAATTTLSGQIKVDLAAYAADGSTPTVRVLLNGELVRAVPAGTTLTATATYDGSTALPLTIEAEDASGNIASETYTDVLVTSLADVQGPVPIPASPLTGTGSLGPVDFTTSKGLPLRDAATGRWCPLRYDNGKPLWIRRS